MSYIIIIAIISLVISLYLLIKIPYNGKNSIFGISMSILMFISIFVLIGGVDYSIKKEFTPSIYIVPISKSSYQVTTLYTNNNYSEQYTKYKDVEYYIIKDEDCKYSIKLIIEYNLYGVELKRYFKFTVIN